METLSNKRKLIIGVLFIIGLLAILRAFGEPSETMSETTWLYNFLGSVFVGASMFTAIACLVKKWDNE